MAMLLQSAPKQCTCCFCFALWNMSYIWLACDSISLDLELVGMTIDMCTLRIVPSFVRMLASEYSGERNSSATFCGQELGMMKLCWDCVSGWCFGRCVGRCLLFGHGGAPCQDVIKGSAMQMCVGSVLRGLSGWLTDEPCDGWAWEEVLGNCWWRPRWRPRSSWR